MMATSSSSTTDLRRANLKGCKTIASYSRNYRGGNFILDELKKEEISKHDENENDQEPKQQEECEIRSHKTDTDMDQCISLLRPHLETFRLHCEEMGKEEEDEVPAQLLRIARFFKWRWAPIRKALLRPPSKDEVEIGCRVRLRLVRSLHCKGLVANAEVDGLSASFREAADKSGSSCQLGTGEEKGGVDAAVSNKRAKIDSSSDKASNALSINHQVQLALSHLPTDIIPTSESDHPKTAAVMQSMRHVRTVLTEYTTAYKKQRNHDTEEKIESPNAIAEWVLSSFTSCILTNGINITSNATTDRNHERYNSSPNVESFLVHLFFPKSPSSSPFPEISKAIEERLQQLLSSQLIDQLSNVHVLVLSRWLCYLPSTDVAAFLSISVVSCSNVCGGVGLLSLPKILALYITNLCKITGVSNIEDTLSLTKAKIKSEMEESIFFGAKTKNAGDEKKKKRAFDLLDLIVQSSSYLISFDDQWNSAT